MTSKRISSLSEHEGSPQRGVPVDFSKRQIEAIRSEAKYRTLFESIDQGFCLCEMLFDSQGRPIDYRFLEVNPYFEKLTGLTQVTGKTVRELVPNLEAFWIETYGSVVQTGKPARFEQQLSLTNRWFDIHAFCIGEPQNRQFAILFTDITDRKRIEEELRQKNAILDVINQSVPTPIFIKDRQGRIIYANPATLNALGKSATEVIGYRDSDLYPNPDDAAKVMENDRRIMESGQTEVVEESPDGVRTFLGMKVPYRNEAGEVIGLVGIANDISQRKQAEEALRQSETRLRLIIESATDYAIFTLDLNGVIDSWNSGAERLLGYSEAEAIGCLGRMIYTAKDQQEGRPEYEMHTALLQGRADNERWHSRKDGSKFWASGLMMPLVNEAGHPQGFVKILQDKTTQKQASDRLQLLYETTSDLLATEQPMALMHNLFNRLAVQLDLQYYYNFMVEAKDNKLMLHLSHYEGISEETAQALEWVNFGDYLCGLVAQERQQIVLNQAQIPTHANAQSLCASGITAYAGQPLLVQGKLLGTLSFASRTRSHFTPAEIELLQSTCDQVAIALERANLTASLQQQAEQLRQANRLKDEFLAVLSHELRSPLNPILGWAKLLQSGRLDAAKTTQAINTIERNAKLQAELIEDLLDVSRILQGKLHLNVTPLHLATTIRAAIETVRLAADAKSITLHTSLDEQVGQVLGDATRLQQVVWNLLSNAVKFTPPGGRVEVMLQAAEVAGDAAPSKDVQITVRDTGKGIAPDFLPYVFDYFRQEDGATTRQFGGLGLGLAIVRHLVELHGGTVRVESPGEGLGATFTVTLPLMPTPTLPTIDLSTSPSSPYLNGVQVLVVDDDPDSQELVAFVLQQVGAQVRTASSAAHGLSLLRQAVPDVLLSDIGMPEQDGYTLMRQIRALSPEQGGMTPAIALTAYAGEVDQQQATAAGFQHHLAKPIDPDVLIRTIARLLTQ